MPPSPTDSRPARRARSARTARDRLACGLVAMMLLAAWRAGAQPAPDAGAGVAAGGAATAGAAGAGGADTNDTDEMITRGVDLRRHGDDQGALPVLRAAYQRGQTPRAAAQLGFVEQALGIWVDAESHLAAAAAAASDPWVAEHASLLDESLGFVRRHIGALVVDSNPPGAEVIVDGLAMGRTPWSAPVRLATGDKRIEARAPGYPAFLTTVTVRAGRTTRVTASFDAGPPARAIAATPAAAAIATTPPSAVITTRAALAAVETAPAPAPGETAGDQSSQPSRPVYKKWWFWTGVAAVLVGVGLVLATSGGPDPFPCGGNGRVCAQ